MIQYIHWNSLELYEAMSLGIMIRLHEPTGFRKNAKMANKWLYKNATEAALKGMPWNTSPSWLIVIQEAI